MTTSIMPYIGNQPQKPLDQQGIPPIFAGSNQNVGGGAQQAAGRMAPGQDNNMMSTLMTLKVLDDLASKNKQNPNGQGGGLFGKLGGGATGAAPAASTGADAVSPVVAGSAFV